MSLANLVVIVRVLTCARREIHVNKGEYAWRLLPEQMRVYSGAKLPGDSRDRFILIHAAVVKALLRIVSH